MMWNSPVQAQADAILVLVEGPNDFTLVPSLLISEGYDSWEV